MARGGSLSVRFSDGTDCTAWTKASIREGFSDALGSYDLTIVPPREQFADYRNRLRRGEPFELLVNGNPLATPIIVSTDARLSSDGCVLDVVAQSKLSAANEGSVDPELTRRFKSDVPVSNVLLEVLAAYGFDTLIGDSSAHVNALTGKAPKGRAAARDVKALTLKELQAQEGETAYQFCSRVFSRLGVVLFCNYKGELYLTAPDYDQAASYTIVQDSAHKVSGDYCVDELTIHDSNDGLYSEVVVRGQSSDDDSAKACAMPGARCYVEGLTRPSGAPYGKMATVPIQAGPGSYSSSSAQWKPRFVCDKEARDIQRCKNMARLIMGTRAAQAYYLEATVAGLVAATGAVWTPDTICHCYIEALGIDDDLWVMDREFTVDDRGERTKLKLIPKGALVLGVD
jgi:prophage tail gpP-like protein